MEENMISSIVQKALQLLEEDVGLAPSSLRIVTSRSFKPILNYFAAKNEACYNESLIIELEGHYRENLQTKAFSKNVYNLRMRGTRVLREVRATGTFIWKGPLNKPIPIMPEKFERIVAGIADDKCSERKNRETQFVVRRFLLSLAADGINSIPDVQAKHMQAKDSRVCLPKQSATVPTTALTCPAQWPENQAPATS
jgi:hypothetical protein